VAKNFFDMEDVSGFMVFCCGLPVAECVEGYLFDSCIFQFDCYSLPLFSSFFALNPALTKQRRLRIREAGLLWKFNKTVRVGRNVRLKILPMHL